MSYFSCAFKANARLCSDLHHILHDIVPQPLRADPLQLSDSPFLGTYGHRKVIPHLIVRNPTLHSWLVVIGTPLVSLKSEHDKTRFLADFFTKPGDALRDTIDGNFAVFAYDAQHDRLIAATDFNNTTPIFYTAATEGVFFSSHELALAKILTPDVDPLGFSQAIHLGVTWSCRTRFRNIFKLLPCQILTVDNTKRLQTERYWRPRDEVLWRGSFKEQTDTWGALLKESVWKFYDFSNRKPVFCDLTAGEDSRLILAQCHALGIPFTAHVKGSADDIDVVVAERAAKKAGFDLIKRARHPISQDQLISEAPRICLVNDAYMDYFSACSDYATDLAEPLDDYNAVKYCGFPGGEAFRGSYYLRGKALFPSMKASLDYKFFLRLKFLLDHHPGLLKYPDMEFIEALHHHVTESLHEVSDYPIGTQIDHLLRVFQTCSNNLMYKDPLYLPFATNRMTRSVYRISPRFKRGGRLTRACTEILFPDLAFVNTQSGVPTVRRTIRRFPIFMPEYIAVTRQIYNGAVGRLFKWTDVNTHADLASNVFKTLLTSPPYSNWFSSSQSMITGQFYNSHAIDTLLVRAKMGSYRYIPTLGRIIAQEFALRWVHTSRHERLSERVQTPCSS
jgi:glutamine amidotransferase-like protein